MAEPTMDTLLTRINELAHKNKAEGLTPEEKTERAGLRQQYLKLFRASFKSQVEMLQVYDKNGKEVTPEKVRQIQRDKGLRDD
ncbi:MAG: DUF896 domain-containing protein [Levilactobacillus sp.]|jgi:uncharacterized protein YnzC (UPF0291/DUF896 family)|uniref:UPF0291 protein EGT51_07520 n=1 Tax=Levilactobacillus suantsaiihabitans TaxID=2487722 RepID=A0A4Z0JAR6_9LACO|nr:MULTISPECIES: DUF896 domain-containing protein [Levilactobacillus]MCH4123210.1 DUF896 domain-containing protein [Levilactobacillus sp.]MCI1552652.1 DUF896 domain-containing protein [Levilactobacillus sp.]MCI1599761.1 DUF896 domain-containing protein [Levilactobacillus sp.]MCI1606383.1 DUF896 domain-containing protein [Levilactobacillus sp.]TGD18728.1 DUF896 domain-containing protein [Levilactobacillus suantsaiihabitans]